MATIVGGGRNAFTEIVGGELMRAPGEAEPDGSAGDALLPQSGPAARVVGGPDGAAPGLAPDEAPDAPAAELRAARMLAEPAAIVQVPVAVVIPETPPSSGRPADSAFGGDMASIPGSGGPDTLEGGAEADVIQGFGGNDHLNGGQGDDSIYGGAGDDRIEDGLSFSADTASDSDQLYGGEGNDTFVSNQGNHFQDNDSIFGGAGDDFIVLNGAQTNDSIDGGTGIDTADIRLSGTTFESVVALFDTAGFVIQLNGINTVFLSTMERIFLSTGRGSDSLLGGALDDSFDSTGGNDTIDGRGGDDVVSLDYYGGGIGTGLNLNGGGGSDILSWVVGQFDSAGYLFNIASGTFRRDGVSVGTVRNFEQLFMSGGLGADTLTGGTLDDIFNAGGGNDILTGGGGDDLLRGDAGSDTIYGGAGNDRLEGDYDSFFGGSPSSNSLFGGEGDDTLSSSSAVDTMNGGQGNDTYILKGADVVVDSGGIDTIQTGTTSLNLTLFGTIENALMENGGTVTGNARNNLIEISDFAFSFLRASGGLGADTLIGGTSFDTLAGEDGNDRLLGRGNNDSLSGGAGNDRAEGGEGFDTLAGDAGNDTLYGGDGADIVYGGDGDDSLRGESEVIASGIGFGSGTLTKSAGTGATRLAAVDVTGNFALFDSPDIISPTLVPHVTVNATVNPGGDWYAITIAAAGVTLTIDVDRAGIEGRLETLAEIYGPTGSYLARDTSGSASAGAGGSVSSDDAFLTYTTTAAGTYYIYIADDTFFGESSDRYTVHISVGEVGGADTLDGGTGADTLIGGFQDDLLIGGAGNDSINGGQGEDTASYAGASGAVTVSLAITGSQNTGAAGFDILTGIENLIGGDSNDRLTGNAASNRLEGGLGNDTLDGGGGSDWVTYAAATAGVTVSLALAGVQNTGGAGNDRLISIENITGSAFDDVLTGTAGNNSFFGGSGNDLMQGGGGGDSLYGGAGVDTASYSGAAAGVRVDLAIVGAQSTGGAGPDLLDSIEAVIGSAFRDQLSGNAFSNALYGGAGNDTLVGREGADTLEGGLGNDMLFGGDDTSRDRVVYTGAAAFSVNLATGRATGAGRDTLAGFEDVITDAGADILTGDANGNGLYGGAGNDTVNAGLGDDMVNGGAGNDVLNGGGGLDTLTYVDAAAGVTVNLSLTTAQNTGGAGTDRISGFEAVVGSQFNDRLTGTAGDDTLNGGGGGNDTLLGGAGRDAASYQSATAGVTVNLAVTVAQDTGGGGTDRLTGFENLIGSSLNDTLAGTGGANGLYGGLGSDLLTGLGGNDTISGGSSSISDTLDGGAGIDTASFADVLGAVTVDLAISGFQSTGAAGFDSITGFENLVGSAYSDTLKGTDGNNRLEGGSGDDVLEGRGGSNLLVGGDGFDTASYLSAAAAVSVDLANTTAQNTGGAGTDRFLSIERLLGSAHADTLWGSSGSDTLDGSSGDDTLNGRGGDDSLVNWLGNDTLNGGAGIDTAVFSVGGTVIVDLTIAGAQNTGNAGTDTLISIENISVTAFSNSSLTGNGLANVLSAISGSDTISGAGGNDTLIGGTGTNLLDGGTGFDTVSYIGAFSTLVAGVTIGATVDLTVTVAQAAAAFTTDTLTSIEGLIGSLFNDTFTGNGGANRLTGEAGDDLLRGGAGADTLAGGLGADRLFGNAGADRFVFDTALGDGTFDIIEDMAAGTDDIALAAAIFAELGPSVTANELRIGAAATTGDHRLIYDAATGTLSYDLDGNGAGAAVHFATLDPGLALTQGDFVII